MSNHTVTIAHGEGGYRAFCNCRATSVTYPHKWEAEDWKLTHKTLVQRVRTHLGYGHAPSLKNQRDWYMRQADNPQTPTRERAQWLMLAEELTRRLADDPGPGDTDGLWSDT